MPEPVQRRRLLVRIAAGLTAGLLFACQAPPKKEAEESARTESPYEEGRGDAMGKN